MTRILLVMAAAVAAFAVQPRPAQASEAPWCLISQGGGNGRCSYSSLEACMRDEIGGGSFCNPNPAYRGGEQRGSVRPQHSRRRH